VCLVGRRPRGYPGTGQMELHTSGHLARGGLFLARRAMTHLGHGRELDARNAR
jgi:hypothetical protein